MPEVRWEPPAVGVQVHGIFAGRTRARFWHQHAAELEDD